LDSRIKNQNTLFSLGMVTYERQDIIQIALKRLPGGGREGGEECRKNKVCQI
jgi:hypothetical protein